MSGFRVWKSAEGKRWKPRLLALPFSRPAGGIAGAGGGGILFSDNTLLKETTMKKVFQMELRKVYPLLVVKAELRNKGEYFL